MQTLRYFNAEGCCKPNVHYMVPLDDRLAAIRELFPQGLGIPAEL